MRLFKWTPSFNVKQEPSIAPVWCRLSGLPLHLFDKKALFRIGELIGEPLKIDDATRTLARINFARICIEMDLKQKPPSEVCVINAGEVLVIPVVYERLPRYCAHCHHLGHDESSCYIKNAGPRPRRNLEKSFPQQKSDKGKGPASTQPPDFQDVGPSEIRTEEPFEVKTVAPTSMKNSFDALALVPYAGGINTGAGHEKDVTSSDSENNSEDSVAETNESDSVSDGLKEERVDADSVHSFPGSKTQMEDPALPRVIASSPASPIARSDPPEAPFEPITAPKKSRIQKEVEALLKSQHGKKEVVRRTRKR